MNGCPPDEPTLQRFIAEIERTRPRPHHASLLAAASAMLPQCPFRLALSRGGWHRPGGVVRADGSRVTEDLVGWVEAEWADCDDDIEAFLDRHADDGLLVTRHAGHSLYFVAALDPDPAAFLQLEVEELQEVLDRRLIDPAHPPEGLPDLTDPVEPLAVAPQPVGRPHYRFRRLTDIRQAVARQPAPVGGRSPLGRFLSDWSASSAGSRGHFCDHWIVALREHQDRYRNSQMSATPVSRHTRKLRAFHWDPEARGTALSDQLHAFDRAAGYPAAWYFHMVAGALTPRTVAYAIAQDMEADYRYLPDCDARLLIEWLKDPYSI